MTPQQFIGLGVRLFAVWLAITSVAYFTSLPAALASLPKEPGPLAISLAFGAAYVLAALLLWFFPMVIAHRVLPSTHHTNHLTLGANDLARTGVALLGLWLLAKALPALVWFFFRSLVFAGPGSTFSSLGVDAQLDIAVSVFNVVLALFFVLRARTVAALVVPPSVPPKDADAV
jgi:hypothetical protein